MDYHETFLERLQYEKEASHNNARRVLLCAVTDSLWALKDPEALAYLGGKENLQAMLQDAIDHHYQQYPSGWDKPFNSLWLRRGLRFVAPMLLWLRKFLARGYRRRVRQLMRQANARAQTRANSQPLS